MRWFPSSRDESTAAWYNSAPWYVRAFYSWGFLLAVAFILAACSHTEPGVEVRLVPTPVPQPCLPADQIPAEPETVGHLLTGNAAADLAVVAASALLLRAWGQEMHTALHACAD